MARVEASDADRRTAQAVEALREAGAEFGYLHGSRATGGHRPESDVDIAAYFGRRSVQSYDVLLPPGVDLVVLENAPLELAGRIAVNGRLLFEVDRVARVWWESTTRKIYLDELPRIRRAHDEFRASVNRG